MYPVGDLGIALAVIFSHHQGLRLGVDEGDAVFELVELARLRQDEAVNQLTSCRTRGDNFVRGVDRVKQRLEMADQNGLVTRRGNNAQLGLDDDGHRAFAADHHTRQV